jgi:2,4-dienoyl-CoA reductase-like NADH-dependent reductase (Old Yellow Enzyme family)
MEIRKTFNPAVVGGIEVKNRIVRSATYEGYTTGNNEPNEQFYEIYENLSKGEVGLIITGYMVFAATDHLPPNVAGINSDTVPSLEKLTDVVHQNGTKIVAQLNHATSRIMPPPAGEVFYGPSEYTDPVTGVAVSALSLEQIEDFIKEFGAAASLAKSAGFDGVQIHGAHGYLLSKFLNPAYNKRTDKYGGNLNGRMQLVADILAEIKGSCGDDFPVWIKLNSSDFKIDGEGITESEFLKTAKALGENGIDAIEVSGGSMTGEHGVARPKKHVAYHLESAKKITGKTTADIILVGGMREIDVIENILSETNIKAVSLSRPLVREPDLVKRWSSGDQTKAKCVACNGCFNPSGLNCFFHLTDEEKEAQKSFMKMMNAS